MPPEIVTFLSIAIPSLIAVVGVIASAAFLRRSNRESNDTNAFKVVTDQLFEDNRVVREDVGTLRKRVDDLEKEVRAKDVRIGKLEDELEDTDKKWRRQINVTRLLANYIKTLIATWPKGGNPPPTPNPPLDWQAHL